MKTRTYKSDNEIVSANFKNKAIFQPDFTDTENKTYEHKPSKAQRKHFSFQLDLTNKILANFGPRGRSIM